MILFIGGNCSKITLWGLIRQGVIKDEALVSDIADMVGSSVWNFDRCFICNVLA